MNSNTSVSLRKLYRELVSAAKSLPWTKSRGQIHHQGNRGNPDPDEDWVAVEQEALRVTTPSDEIFHVQLQVERHGRTAQSRLIIFGRRMNNLTQAAPNAQRATFNSENRTRTDYWLKPRMSPAAAEAIATFLPGPAFPFWAGDRVQLGTAEPYAVLRRFLIALSAIERAKADNRSSPFKPPFSFELQSAIPEFEQADLDDLRMFSEGRLDKVTLSKRRRCQRLLGEIQEYFRSQHKDGKLQCRACGWATPLPIRSEIVQIHHHKTPLHRYPPKGMTLSLRQAVENVVPLCPTCHRLIEASPSSANYTLDEIRTAQLVPLTQQSTGSNSA